MQWTMKQNRKKQKKSGLPLRTYITTKTNTSQMAIEQQEGANVEEELNIEETPTHGYNLRNQPTRHTKRVSMTQTENIKGVENIVTTGVEGNIMKIHSKSHAPIMLTQVNAKQGLLKQGKKRIQAISKEL